MHVTLEEVFNGAMKTVKIKRFLFIYSELVFVKLVKEKEVRIVLNVQNVKELELLLRWFNWAQACILNLKVNAGTAKAKEK